MLPVTFNNTLIYSADDLKKDTSRVAAILISAQPLRDKQLNAHFQNELGILLTKPDITSQFEYFKEICELSFVVGKKLGLSDKNIHRFIDKITSTDTADAPIRKTNQFFKDTFPVSALDTTEFSNSLKKYHDELKHQFTAIHRLFSPQEEIDDTSVTSLPLEQNHTEELERLNQELARLQKSLTTLSTEHDKQTQELAQEKKEKEALKAAEQALITSLSSIRKMIEKNQKSMKDQESPLIQKIDDQSQKLDKFMPTLKKLKEKVSEQNLQQKSIELLRTALDQPSPPSSEGMLPVVQEILKKFEDLTRQAQHSEAERSKLQKELTTLKSSTSASDTENATKLASLEEQLKQALAEKEQYHTGLIKLLIVLSKQEVDANDLESKLDLLSIDENLLDQIKLNFKSKSELTEGYKSQNNLLTQKIQDNEKEIAQLKQELNTLKASTSVPQDTSQANQAQEQLAALAAKNKSLTEQLQSQENLNALSKQQLTSQANQSQEQLTALASENKSLKAQLQDQEVQHTLSKGELTTLRAEIEEVKSMNSQMEHTHKEQLEQISTLQKSKTKFLQLLTNASAQKESLTKEYENLKTQNESLEQECLKAKANVHTANETTSKSIEKAHQLERDNERLRKELSDLKGSYKGLQEENKDLTETLGKIQRDHTALQEELSDLRDTSEFVPKQQFENLKQQCLQLQQQLYRINSFRLDLSPLKSQSPQAREQWLIQQLQLSEQSRQSAYVDKSEVEKRNYHLQTQLAGFMETFRKCTELDSRLQIITENFDTYSITLDEENRKKGKTDPTRQRNEAVLKKINPLIKRYKAISSKYSTEHNSVIRTDADPRRRDPLAYSSPNEGNRAFNRAIARSATANFASGNRSSLSRQISDVNGSPNTDHLYFEEKSPLPNNNISPNQTSSPLTAAGEILYENELKITQSHKPREGSTLEPLNAKTPPTHQKRALLRSAEKERKNKLTPVKSQSSSSLYSSQKQDLNKSVSEGAFSDTEFRQTKNAWPTPKRK